MRDVLSSSEAAIDYALLEKVNPVFHTAKMTLFQLAENGDPDAVVLAESMGLTREAAQNSANTTHMTGLISFTLPVTTLSTTQVMMANMMPVAME